MSNERLPSAVEAAGLIRRVAAEGDECARGTGTFLRSHIALSGLAGYRAP